MRKLSSNFKLERYGMHVRLVDEDDVEFILKLRTNRELTKHIFYVENNANKQIQWIQEYKKRENNGEDYYFIYSYNGNPIGLNRLSEITGKTAEGGSLVFDPKSPFECPVYATLIQLDIAFTLLELDTVKGYMKKSNKRSYRFNKLMGAIIVDEDDQNYYIQYRKNNYLENKNRIEDSLK